MCLRARRERNVSKVQELQTEIGLLDADLVQVQGTAALQDAPAAEVVDAGAHAALIDQLHQRLLEHDAAHPSQPGTRLARCQLLGQLVPLPLPSRLPASLLLRSLPPPRSSMIGAASHTHPWAAHDLRQER